MASVTTTQKLVSVKQLNYNRILSTNWGNRNSFEQLGCLENQEKLSPRFVCQRSKKSLHITWMQQNQGLKNFTILNSKLKIKILIVPISNARQPNMWIWLPWWILNYWLRTTINPLTPTYKKWRSLCMLFFLFSTNKEGRCKHPTFSSCILILSSSCVVA